MAAKIRLSQIMYALLLLGHGSQNTAQPNCVCLAIARTWQPKYGSAKLCMPCYCKDMAAKIRLSQIMYALLLLGHGTKICRIIGI